MSKYNYLLSYNVFPDNFTLSQLQVFISQNRSIDGWYVPCAGTYLLKSDLELSLLNSQFNQFFGQSIYLLTWLAPGHSMGSLPDDIWSWLNNIQNPFLPEK